MTLIKEKTGSSEVKVSEETLKVEQNVYHNLIDGKAHGKVTGFSCAMTAKDLHAKYRKSESKLLVNVLNKIMSKQKQVDVLTTKIIAKATNSQLE